MVMKTDNVISTKKRLIKACVETANRIFGSDRSIQVLHLWVRDPTYKFLFADDGTFIDELRDEFKSHLIRPLIDAKIEIHNGAPKDKTTFGVLIPNAVDYSYDYSSKEICKLFVRLHLLSTEKKFSHTLYLDSSKRQYCIGRENFCYDEEGRFRENDIVVNDEHISRAQADLYFKDGKIFLRPTSTGYRPNGNPTRVHTKGTLVDLTDEYKGYQLQDGDIIELGGRNGVLYKVSFNDNDDSQSSSPFRSMPAHETSNAYDEKTEQHSTKSRAKNSEVKVQGAIIDNSF